MLPPCTITQSSRIFHRIPISISISCRHPLVLRSSLLARLQLIQIPPADGQAALVLIHALAEVVDVRLAGAALVGSLALLVLLREVGVLGRGLGGRGGAAAEEAADGVADGGAYCDTAAEMLAHILCG